MNKRSFLLTCLVLIGFTQVGMGQIRWDGGASTSNWTDVLNWSGDAFPTASDDVILDNTYISGSYTITLPGTTSAQTIKSLQVGYVGNSNIIGLTIGNEASGVANVLTLNGGGATALYIENGGVLTNQSTNATRGIKLTNATDVFKMSGNGKYVHATSSVGSKIPQLTSGTSSSNYNFASTSVFELQTATFDVTPTYGDFTYNVNATNSAGVDLIILGDLAVLQGTLGVCASTSNTFSISGNVLVSNSTTLRGSNGTGTATITISGNVTGVGTFQGCSNSSGTTNITLGGNLSSLISFGSGTNSLTFSGGTSAVSFTPSNSSTPSLKATVSVANGKTVTLGANISVYTGFSFTVDGILDCGTNTIAGGGSFVLGNTATLMCGHADGIFGNIPILGTKTFPASSTYIFNGLVAQSVSSLLPDNLTGTLTIDNVQGVSMNVDRTISTGIVNLQNGVLKTRVASTIHNFTIGSSVTINVLSPTGYIDGPLIMTLASGIGRTFPIGSGNAYRPLILNYSVGQNVIAEMFNTAPSGPYSGIGIDKISLVRYYSVSNSTNSNVTVAIPWGTDDGVSDLSYITTVYGANSTIWLGNSRSGSTTGDATAGTVTGTFNNIFGADFTLGNITGGLNPLPVELTSFSASVRGNAVTLAWKTATEVDNYGFEIERTPLFPPFDKGGTKGGSAVVGFVNGAGNSNSPQQYRFVDKSLPIGTYLYRLKQIDNDGKYTYSSEVEATIAIPAVYSLEQNYPNPFNPTTSIQYSVAGSQNVTIKIFNVLGKEVAVLVDEKKEPGVYSVEYNASHLASGLYLYRLQAGDVVLVKKMVVLK